VDCDQDLRPTGHGADFGETLYLRMHRIHSGQQTLTVTVPASPPTPASTLRRADRPGAVRKRRGGGDRALRAEADIFSAKAYRFAGRPFTC
jgi:hypothetical protein